MAGTLTPTPFQTVLDTDGVAVSGALIYTYVGGTTTNATTYADASLATANANPIVADAAGRFVAYLPAGGNFKFLYKTAAGATIEEQDNILSVPGAAVNLDIEGTVGQAVTAGQVCYLSTGAEATPLTAGLWYLTDADFAPTSTTCQSIGVAVSAIAINTAGTIRLAGTATTATAVVIGSTYYVSATAGAITATAPALSRTVGVALTTSTLLLAATTAVVTPGGSNTQVQFNDAGVLGGDSGFTFIKATDAVAIAGATTVGGTLGVTGATTLSSGTYSTFLKSTTALATPAALTATQATAFASTVSGSAIMGFGTTNDVSLMNRAGTVVLGVGPNTTAVDIPGTLAVTGAVTGGTYNSQTISSAASFTGSVAFVSQLRSVSHDTGGTAMSATELRMLANNTYGAILAGYGTTSDVAIFNKSMSLVAYVPTGTTNLNLGGLLTVSGFGTSSFSAGGTGGNRLQIKNTTAGTGNFAGLDVFNNAGNLLELWAHSSTYTTSGPNVANGVIVNAKGAGGLSISSEHASGAIRFYAGGTTLRGSFDTSGNLGLVLPLKLQNNSSAMTTALAMSGNAYDVVILGGNSNYSGLYYSATVPAANAGLNGAVQVTTTGLIYFYSGGSRYVLTGVLA